MGNEDRKGREDEEGAANGIVSLSITLQGGFGKGQTHPEPPTNHPKFEAGEWFDPFHDLRDLLQPK